MWVLIIAMAVMSAQAFVSPGAAQLVLRGSHRGNAVVQYKVEKKNMDDGGDEQRPASGWKRFIPGVVRNRLDKKAPEPEMDSSNRYVLFWLFGPPTPSRAHLLALTSLFAHSLLAVPSIDTDTNFAW
jgi:hypothetical protein